MNSEILHEIEKASSQTKFDNAESDILQKSYICEDFMQHPGWKTVVEELENIKRKTLQDLLNLTTSDNLQKMQARRYLINAIDLFIASPSKFINQRSMILLRRKKNAR